MSSLMTMISVPFRTSARAFSSSKEYAAPVGFEGLLRMRAFVLAVMAFLSFAGVSLNPSDSPPSTNTGVASASSTMSG